MSDEELSRQLLEGLRNLHRDLKLFNENLLARGLHASDTVVKYGNDSLKLQYVNQCLQAVGDIEHA